jgi:hypothetical protein
MEDKMSTLSARSRDRAGNLTAAAAGRLNVIKVRIERLRRRATFDLTAAEEYRALLDECGRLDQILADLRED